ncbi:acyl-CoA thioesterase [Halorubrum laminariae]|uniref:Acyl-CoA thioesterase n=1 Tax=Halorubrum laminariae TaxID=1433523 RepID=A0ABD6BWJ4_9EURY|nr:thioesterase family protein [Halorubrum laminariae]
MTVHTTEIEVRFRDIDALGHVNNAVYATYIEQARTAYFRDVLDADLSRASTVLASTSFDFRRSVELTDKTVTVKSVVDEIGRTSVSMSYEIRIGSDDGDLAAEAEATIVSLDPETGEPTPVPEPMRAKMTAYHDL